MDEGLVGGYRSQARRAGDKVVRGPSSDYAVQLLRFLEECQWPHAPRVINCGPNESVLSFVEGDAALTRHQRHKAAAPDALARVAELVRAFHDLSAGSPLTGERDVVCHNDLDPRNTIYRSEAAGIRPIALIDWDLAAPGDRIHDVAHVCWTFTCLEDGDIDAVQDRITTILNGYGWAGSRKDVIDAMLWWQDRCWRGIENGAAAGDPAMQRLVTDGITASIRTDYAWTAEHRHAL